METGQWRKRSLRPLVLEPRRKVPQTFLALRLTTHDRFDGGVDGVDELVAFELEEEMVRKGRGEEEGEKKNTPCSSSGTLERCAPSARAVRSSR